MIDALKAAFVQGRLSKSELARRAGHTLEARTYGDLARATANIPPSRPAPRSAPVPVHRPDAARPVNRRLIAWVVGATIVAPGLGVAFFATVYGSFFILLLLGLIAATAVGPSERPVADRHDVY